MRSSGNLTGSPGGLSGSEVEAGPQEFPVPPIHEAVTANDPYRVEKLLRESPRPLAYVSDVHGFSPLHRAAWCADTHVASALLLSSVPRWVTFATPRAFARPSGVAFYFGLDGRFTCGYLPDADTRSVAAVRVTTGPRPGSPSLTARPSQAAASSAEAARAAGSSRGAVMREIDIGFYRWLSAQSSEDGDLSNADGAVMVPALRWRPGMETLVNLPHADSGRTPLMLAAIRGDVAVVSLLIDECMADVHVVDTAGYTAAELAALCGHSDVLEAFMAKATNSDGTGRALPTIQAHAEDYVLTASTVQQQQRLGEINRRICADLSQASVLSLR